MKLLQNVLNRLDLVTNIVLKSDDLSYVTPSHHHHQQPQSVPVVTLWTPHHTTPQEKCPTWRINLTYLSISFS